LEQGKKNKEQGSGAAQQGRPKSDSIDIALAKKFCALKAPWHKKNGHSRLLQRMTASSPMCPMLQVARMATKRPERTLGFASNNSFAPNRWLVKLKKSLKAKIFVA